MANLHTYGEPELQRWLHLRAIEWAAWPAFVTQPVIPILFIFFPVLSVIGILIADFIWRFIRYSFVSPSLADAGASFVIFLKWPCAIGSAIYLFIDQQYGSAILALLWPVLASFLSAPVSLLASAIGRPTLVGRI